MTAVRSAAGIRSAPNPVQNERNPLSTFRPWLNQANSVIVIDKLAWQYRSPWLTCSAPRYSQ